MKLTIILGCFNEKPTILEAIKEAKSLPIEKEIIVIDNASTDGTRELLQNLKDDSLKIILKDKNLGPGHTAKMGIEMAKGDFFYIPGTDLEYRMADVLDMFKKLENEDLDIVFGSRLLGNNKPAWQQIKERPFWLGTYIATFIVNILFGRNFTDILAPKLYKLPILKSIKIDSNGHASEFETASILCKKGYKIGETAISYKPRLRSEGKTIRVMDMIPALWAILKVKFG